uniref:DNA-directed RNA polymerase III subunit RPC9 n=1 Tax=Palpitomonas bilix TaxID=652834 RepID=A0A7S3CWI3_9EUKA|mmetsp:Transcript_12227/g.32854  ORF Transcript_12227/g.32854 Transcript_12227/m.32854 type:complete len:501 (+) Transcript_12227:31-1533(+)
MKILNPCVGLVTNAEVADLLRDNVENRHLRSKAVREGLQSEEVVNFLVLCLRSFDSSNENPRRYVILRQLFTRTYQDIYRYMKSHSLKDIHEKLLKCTSAEIERFEKLKTRADFKEERAVVLGSKVKRMSKKDQLNGEKHWEGLLRGGKRRQRRGRAQKEEEEEQVLNPLEIAKKVKSEREEKPEMIPLNDSPPHDIPSYRTNSLDPEYEARDRLLKSLDLHLPNLRSCVRFLDIPPVHRLVLKTKRPYRAVYRLAELENTNLDEVEELFKSCKKDMESFVQEGVSKAIDRNLRSALHPHEYESVRARSGIRMDVEKEKDPSPVRVILDSGVYSFLSLEETLKVIHGDDLVKREMFEEADKVFDGQGSSALSAERDLRYLTMPESRLHRKILGYLDAFPSGAQEREQVQTVIASLSKFDLTKVEVLQIVNTRPACLVYLYATIEECASRLSEDAQQEIIDIVKTLPPPKPPVEKEEKAKEVKQEETEEGKKVDDGRKKRK